MLFLCALCQALWAQDDKRISFQNITVEDGLTQNSVIDIAQDSIGYLWLATQDGLNRYSGKDFVHYNKQFEDITRPDFSTLGKVYVDKENRLWIVTNSGQLECYDRLADSFNVLPEFSTVSCLYQNRKLDFYIGTYGDGLYKIDANTKDTAQVFNHADNRITVYDILANNDSLWVACSGKVYVFNTAGEYSEIPVEGMDAPNFSRLEKTQDNTLWLGSYGRGLYYKPGNRKEFFSFQHPKLPRDLNIEDLLVDSKNRLWIATYGNGAYLYDPKDNTVQNFTENQDNPFAIQYNDLLCLFEDDSGVLWIGSDGAGANYYDSYHLKFNMLTDKQMPAGTTVDVIRSITTDNLGNLWLGTSGKGLTKINYEKDSYHTYTPENSLLPSGRIISLHFDGTELWIGHQGFGVDIGDPSGRLKRFPELANHTIWRIVGESNTQSWLCTERNGLILFDKNQGVIARHNTQNSILPTDDIKTVVKANDSIIWIGTDEKGLFKLYVPTSKITPIHAIPDKIKSLYYANGILWVGTNGNGLKKYNTLTGDMVHFSTEQGLPNRVIYGILPDDNQHLWLSSNKGIIKFNTHDYTITKYDNSAYLQSYEFNTGAYHRDTDGTLYFGGLKGLNWFKPEQLKTNPVRPKTVITKLEVFTKEYPLSNHLTLPHNENTVSFTFSSLQFSQPEQNQYKYRLINNDEDWISSGNFNVAHYTNLPPNDYIFQVISSNYDGKWGNSPAAFSFTIRKPWYASNIAMVLYFLLVLLLGYAMYYYLKWRWSVKNQLKLEQEESKRLKKLDELKTNLYGNISHEFLTPLTLIAGPIENQLNRPHLTEQDKKELRMVKHNTDRLVDLINQMMALSVLDSGQVKLNLTRGNLNARLLQLLEAFQYKAQAKQITINSTIQGLEDCWFDTDVIDKILSNLLSNAVKYAPPHSVVQVDAKVVNDSFSFSIVNKTQQIKSTDLSKLFQRFYQDNDSSEGVGIGLALVKELADLANGSVKVNTPGDNEIQFTVFLPISKPTFVTETIDIVPVRDAILENNNPAEESNNFPIESKVGNHDLPKLLIVEDNLEMRRFILSNFTNEFQILEAENGQIGIEQAQEHLPDLIISDVMMPLANGFELCDAIKQNTLTSHIPVILLTAKMGEENEIRGIKTGADAYITKPFSVEKLRARVQQLLEAQKRLVSHFKDTFSINPELAITNTEATFLKRLKSVMDEHITDGSFNTDTFSHLMQMSRRQLHRKLKAIIGMTPTEFVRNQRVKLASELLMKSDATVVEIAYQVGFNTPSYFIKCFKEIYGCTPSAFAANS